MDLIVWRGHFTGAPTAAGKQPATTLIARVMRLTAFLLLLACMQVSARVASQTVSVTGRNMPLVQVFAAIERQTGFVVVYNSALRKKFQPITVAANQQPLSDLLRTVLDPQDLKFEIESGNIVVTAKAVAPTPSNTSELLLPPHDIAGRIITATGEPAAGVTVTIKGSQRATATGADGQFKLTAVEENGTLVITGASIEPLEVAVGNKTYFNITVTLRVNMLDESIVMAYGTTSRRLNTGSISKVSGEDISRQPVANPLGALQGRVPGLVVTQSSGVAGASFKVQIRGQNSLVNGSEPLFIIDGVPFAPNNQSVNVIQSSIASLGSNNGISPFANINPDDIASIEVLKDADATAIYGSRGANGVILITTKRGQTGKTTVNANVRTGRSDVAHMEPLLSTPEYLAMRTEAFTNDGITPSAVAGSAGYAPDLTIWSKTRQVDWQQFLIGNTAHTTDANVSVSGGSAQTQFLVGAGYHYENSIFPTDIGYRRASVNFGINHKSTDGRFTLDVTNNYSSGNNQLFGSSLRSILLPPNTPELYTADGQLNWQEGGASFVNPAADFLKSYSIKTDNLLTNVKIGYRLAEGLTFLTSLGYNSLISTEHTKTPIISLNPNSGTSLTGSAVFGNTEFKSYIIEPQLNYLTSLGGGKVTALLGGSWQYTNTANMYIAGEGYTTDGLLKSIDAAPVINTKTNDYSRYKYAAVFGRLTYNWKDRYIVNGSLRRDGSSRFGPGRRFNTFGAIGAAWLFSNTDWVKHQVPILSFGKLRSSYGVTGNDQIGNYKYLDTWSATGTSPYQGSTSIIPDILFNGDYAWERNKKWEAALETGWFQNRLFTTIAYFKNRCDNQLVDYTLPTQTGFSSITRNFPAVIENSGWELELTAELINKSSFSWKVSVNASIPRNELVSFPGLAASTYYTKYEVGQSVNVLKKIHAVEINPATGVYTLDDVDKNGTLNAKDYYVSGRLNPDWYGGLRNTLQWQGFELDFLFDAKKQIAPDYFYSAYLYNLNPGMLANQPALVLNRWQKAGDVAQHQKFTANTAGPVYRLNLSVYNSDAVYVDASYIKLRNLYLSYSFSAAKMKNWKMKNLRLYLQGQNLFTITGYKGFDPETPVYFSVPALRTVTAGLQLSL